MMMNHRKKGEKNERKIEKVILWNGSKIKGAMVDKNVNKSILIYCIKLKEFFHKKIIKNGFCCCHTISEFIVNIIKTIKLYLKSWLLT